MNKQAGFTLVELMIALGLTAVLASVAIPSFAGLIQSNRVTSYTNDLIASLATARSEAVKRGQRVAVCRSSDQATCGAGSSWADGWVVFLDVDKEDDIDDVSDIISVHSALAHNGLSLNATKSAINYRPDGASNSGSVSFCDARGIEHSRKISVNFTGRFRTVDAESSDCP